MNNTHIQQLSDPVIAVMERLIVANDSSLAIIAQPELLEQRKELLNAYVLQHQEELLPAICTFNQALTEAFRGIYDRALLVFRTLDEQGLLGPNDVVTGHCYLSSRYPSLHPLQGDGREGLWSALLDPDWNSLYADGCSIAPIRFVHGKEPQSFESFMGMDLGNWNEGLDRELTKNCQLTSAFHHLFDHTHFALTDFIYCREFEPLVKVEMR